ncbi:MAG: energy transducer TonB [Exilispira sp.]
MIKIIREIFSKSHRYLKRNNNFNINSGKRRLIFSIILSFSLHLFIIIFINLLIQNQNILLEKKDVDTKPVEIKILSMDAFSMFNEESNKNNIEKELKSKTINNMPGNDILNKIENYDKIKYDRIKDYDKIKDYYNVEEYNESDKENNNILYDEKTKNISSDNQLIDGKNENNEIKNDDSTLNNSQFLSESSYEYNEYNQFVSKNILSYSINFNTLFDYPKDALKLRIEGTVKIRIKIDTNGRVIEVILLESSGSKILDNYTIKKANQLLFSFPQDKKPESPIWVTIKVVYSIKSSVFVETL